MRRTFNSFFGNAMSFLFYLVITLSSFLSSMAFELTCYSGDWSKPKEMSVVRCGRNQRCGIILRFSASSELLSEADCYNETNIRGRWWRKILINLSDSRLPKRAAVYLCRAERCNKKSKYIQLKARWRSSVFRNGDKRHAMLYIDEDRSKLSLEHLSGGRDGSENVYRESTKIEKANENRVRKYRQKSLYFEGRESSNLTDDEDGAQFWRMFQ